MIRRALLLIALCGCPGSTPAPPCSFGGSGGGVGTSGNTLLGFVGQPMNVPLQLSLPVTCRAEEPMVSRVDVSVLDPGNMRVAATVSAPQVAGGEASATITFTPATAGPYHLSARFEPGLGTAQTDVLVATDKSAEPANMITIPALNCLQIDLAGDTLLCLNLENGVTSLRTVHGGLEIDRRSANAFALSGDRVWSHSDDDQSVHLYQLAPTGMMAQLASFAVNLNGTPMLFAHGDQAVVFDMNSFFEASYSADAGFTLTNDVAVAPSNDAVPQGGQWLPEAGFTAATGDSQVCTYAADAGNFTPGACSGGVTVVGYDDDGIWWIDQVQLTPNASRVSVTGWQLGQSQPTTDSVVVGTPMLTPVSIYGQGAAPQSSPLVYATDSVNSTIASALFLPQRTAHGIVLTRYPFMAGSLHADSKRLWYQGGNTIVWYPR